MKPPWRRIVLAFETPKLISSSWLFTIVYCSLAFFFFGFAVLVWRHVVAVLASGFFAAWGVVYLVVTIRMSIGRAKFGAVDLVLESPTPTVGGRLVGSVVLPRMAFTRRVIVELTCERVTYGDKGAEQSAPLWATKLPVPIRQRREGRVASFAIEIPETLPPSRLRAPDEAIEGDYCRWNLRLTAEVPGVDLDRNYPITVDPAQTVAPAEPSAPPAAARTLPAQRPIPAASARPAAPSTPVAPTPPTLASPARGAAVTETPVPRPAVRDHTSLGALIAANLLPIAGVAFWGWRVQETVFLYWIENLVIGAVNILKILGGTPDGLGRLARRGVEVTPGRVLAAKLALISFFVVHYGGFCYAHGEFLVSLFVESRPGSDAGLSSAAGDVLLAPATLAAVLALLASHAFSFVHDYVGNDEYRRVNVAALMFRPYGRVVVTHLFIIAGGLALEALKSPLAAMIVFVVLKIVVDAWMHRREHALAPPREADA